MPGRKGARVRLPSTLSGLYGDAHPQAGARCGFRDFFRNPTVGRRHAYLSSSTHLPGGDLWHTRSGFHICHTENIYTAEAELEAELG
jgi:hypothetical protein